jgi:hypothetical protein
VSEADFVAVQKISAVFAPKAGPPGDYLLARLIICGSCGRRAESQWAYNRPTYRCRHGCRGARSRESDRPFHAREDRLLTTIAVQLDIRTGQGQTRWPDADIAAYLQTHGLTVRCARDAAVIVGLPPPKDNQNVAAKQPTPKEQPAPASPDTPAELGRHGQPLENRRRKAAPRLRRKRRLIRRRTAAKGDP